MKRPLTTKNLLDIALEAGCRASSQQQESQAALIFQAGERQFPLFLRILPEGPYIQLMALFPLVLKEAALNDAARQLHYINKLLVIPGFGLDDDERLVFYRMLLPAFDTSVDEQALQTALREVERTCNAFAATIEQVAGAALNYSDYRAIISKETGQ